MGWRLWPFGQKQENGTAAPGVAAGTTSIKQCAVQYLDATLTVLAGEQIPLAAPAHGRPARGARFLQIPVRLDRRRVGPLAMRKVLSAGTLSAIQAAANVPAVNAWQEKSAIVYQYQLEQTLWKYYRRTDLPSPNGIGLGVGRRLVQFRLDNKNTLVAGETRSGKSVTIESILFSIMASHPAGEVGLVIIDPNQTLGIRKDGLKAIEVGRFTNAVHLLRPIAYTYPQAHDAIDYVYAEWKRRMSGGIQDGPGLVLVIDELMSEAVIGDKESRSHNEEHLTKLSQLASQGIKNNVFLVLGAQDPKIGNTSGLLMRNLGLRYIGHVTDANASRVLAGREGVNAHLLTENGDFVEVSGTSMARFQVAEPTRADFDRLERRPVADESVGPVEVLDLPQPPANGNTQESQEFDPALLLPPEPNVGGNREVQVDMRTLALYFHERKLSIAQAAERYGIKRRVHEEHREAARELAEEVAWLRAGNPPRSPYYLQNKNDDS